MRGARRSRPRATRGIISLPDALFSGRLESDDPEQTRALGARLGAVAEAGDLLLLEGDFGSGKTVLVQGLASGLGVQTSVGSPSFVIINEHAGRLRLYHVDLYRAKRLDPELEETVADVIEAGGVTTIEWPRLLPPDLRAGGGVHADRVGRGVLGGGHAVAGGWAGRDGDDRGIGAAGIRREVRARACEILLAPGALFGRERWRDERLAEQRRRFRRRAVPARRTRDTRYQRDPDHCDEPIVCGASCGSGA